MRWAICIAALALSQIAIAADVIPVSVFLVVDVGDQVEARGTWTIPEPSTEHDRIADPINVVGPPSPRALEVHEL
jgi:hypothetical protein